MHHNDNNVILAALGVLLQQHTLTGRISNLTSPKPKLPSTTTSSHPITTLNPYTQDTNIIHYPRK
jgi:hypothetical protein